MTTRKSCGRCQCAGLAHNLGFVSRNRCQLACEILVFNPTGAEWSLQSALLHIFGFCCWCEEITIPQRGLSLNLKKKNICLFSPLFLFLQWYKLRVKEAESSRSAKKNGQVSSRPIFSANAPCWMWLLSGVWKFMGLSGTSMSQPGQLWWTISKFSNNVELPKVRYATCQGRLVRWGCCQSCNDSNDRPLTLCLMGSYQAGADRHSVRSLVLKSLSMNTLLLAFFFFAGVDIRLYSTS